MKLRYKTGAATIIQLSVMLLLNFLNALYSMITGCIHHDSCVEGVVINLLFVLVLAIWLLFLAAVGYMTEQRRSRRFALVLLVAESLVALATLSNIRHYPNLFGLFTSLIDFSLAVWVMVLAYPIWRANSPTAPLKAAPKQRPRRRLKP